MAASNALRSDSMPPSRRWTDVTISEHAHEKAALNFIRARFSDREPFRAWSNFTFLADDGSMNEVDLLVVSPTGVYLVEIKSHPGRMEGDQGTWRWLPPDGGRVQRLDHPLELANRKAKKLVSLLRRQPALRERDRRKGGFFLQAVVFLSDPTLRVALDASGRQHVYGPDAALEEEQVNDLPGIMELFNKVDRTRPRRVDRPLSAAIAQALDQAGIRQSTKLRKAGHYELGELIDEGDGWQDYEARNPKLDRPRRLRIYQTEAAVSEEEEKALSRAAEREMKILKHVADPRVERPLDLVPSARGPALVFEWEPNADRLDHWLEEHAEDLAPLDRIELVQQLAEAVRIAHRQGVYHRALSPRNVRVLVRDGAPELRIRDWQAATREATTTATATWLGTEHVGSHVPKAEHLYLAPEVTTLPDPEPLPADIWSLGALAVLILSGRPPAPDLDGLREILREHHSLSLSAVMDAPPPELLDLVAGATQAEATDRFVSVDEFLEYLGLALEEMTRPEPTDPLRAEQGDELDDGSRVLRRVGTGSTSLVLVVETGDRQEVLKVARSEEHTDRMKAEYEALSRLRHPTIIEPYAIDMMAGRSVLRLEPAVETLRERIRRDGRLSLDLLDRFGTDLLDAVVLLDEEGVAHRDIKPENLGIVERGKNKERRLALFDFSLAGSDPSDIEIGTRGYRDPFLEEREPPRWDGQAERYAAAVTLYEMATATRPRWGDGSTDPALTDLDQPEIDAELIDSTVRPGLVEFFRKALHRKPGERFHTAGEMRDAWIRVFRGTETEPGLADEGVPPAELDLTGVKMSSSLHDLPISARLRDALQRLDAVQVKDLLAIPGGDLVRISGVGALTRAEVNHLARRLREHLTEEGVATGAPPASINRIADQLVPRPPADEDHRTVARTLLGLIEGDLPAWPTMRDVTAHAGLEPHLIADAVGSARTRWQKRPVITEVRREIAELLAERGGIAGGDELAGLLLSNRGCVGEGKKRSRLARAVVRAAVEVEAGLGAPSFVIRRVEDALLVALDGSVEINGETRAWDADALAEGAARLAERAAELAGRDPLPGRDEVVRSLREVELPDDVPEPGDARRVRLAAAAASGVAATPQLVLYPTGMSAERAIEETRPVLLSRGGLTVDEVHARVRARFPEAEPLPERPELDRLLERMRFEWDAEEGRFVLPERRGFASTMTSLASATEFMATDERQIEFRELDRRLALLRESGGFLALSVDLRRLGDAGPAVAAATGGTHLRVDRMLIERLRALAEGTPRARWEAWLEADARRDERPWTLLRRMVDQVLPEIEKEILGTPGVVVLTELGLLARYGRLEMIERLRDRVTVQAKDDPLRGVVVVTPAGTASSMPMIDGHPIPVTTPNQRGRLPRAWLDRPTEGEAA
jgi:serine/threonine protein kinase